MYWHDRGMLCTTLHSAHYFHRTNQALECTLCRAKCFVRLDKHLRDVHQLHAAEVSGEMNVRPRGREAGRELLPNRLFEHVFWH